MQKTALRFSIGHAQGPAITVRCPQCSHVGVLERLPNVNDVTWSENQGWAPDWIAGLRRCPNPACRALICYVSDGSGGTTFYPAEVIDFDASNLPAPILSTLEEAVKCHSAGCFRASSLMVRRVLEELCDDRGIKSGNLKKKISDLSKTIIVPPELLEAADELRLLGNDAAHIEAALYNNLGEQESALAIELAKELLKAVYQYASLVGRLRALKGNSGAGEEAG